MNIWDSLVLIYVMYIIRHYLIVVINKDKRAEHKRLRIRLNELRNIPVKTQAEQREFLDLKYPKKPPTKITLTKVIKFIIKIGLMIVIFILIRKFWVNYIPYNFVWWTAIITVIILPLLINTILQKYGLEQDDIRIWFGGKKK